MEEKMQQVLIIYGEKNLYTFIIIWVISRLRLPMNLKNLAKRGQKKLFPNKEIHY
mgnify:CR=1 FL=1